jgi:hypothetical protein
VNAGAGGTNPMDDETVPVWKYMWRYKAPHAIGIGLMILFFGGAILSLPRWGLTIFGILYGAILSKPVIQSFKSRRAGWKESGIDYEIEKHKAATSALFNVKQKLFLAKREFWIDLIFNIAPLALLGLAGFFANTLGALIPAGWFFAFSLMAIAFVAVPFTAHLVGIQFGKKNWFVPIVNWLIGFIPMVLTAWVHLPKVLPQIAPYLEPITKSTLSIASSFLAGDGTGGIYGVFFETPIEYGFIHTLIFSGAVVVVTLGLITSTLHAISIITGNPISWLKPKKKDDIKPAAEKEKPAAPPVEGIEVPVGVDISVLNLGDEIERILRNPATGEGRMPVETIDDLLEVLNSKQNIQNIGQKRMELIISRLNEQGIELKAEESIEEKQTASQEVKSETPVEVVSAPEADTADEEWTFGKEIKVPETGPEIDFSEIKTTPDTGEPEWDAGSVGKAPVKEPEFVAGEKAVEIKKSEFEEIIEKILAEKPGYNADDLIARKDILEKYGLALNKTNLTLKKEFYAEMGSLEKYLGQKEYDDSIKNILVKIYFENKKYFDSNNTLKKPYKLNSFKGSKGDRIGKFVEVLDKIEGISPENGYGLLKALFREAFINPNQVRLSGDLLNDSSKLVSYLRRHEAASIRKAASKIYSEQQAVVALSQAWLQLPMLK